MAYQRVSVGEMNGFENVGSLSLPHQWRVDARNAKGRSLAVRPWHDEELLVPLERIAVDPDRVLLWDNNPERKNSPRRIARMLASRAIPLEIMDGNGMRNVIHKLDCIETADEVGYSFSRIALARRVIAQLATEPGQRKGHHRSANMHAISRYIPPSGEALAALIDIIRGPEGE